MNATEPLCIIPARGDSPGLPKKNIKSIDGKPLVAHTIDTAIACSSLEDVFVSTESETIAEIARQRGARVPFMRPDSLTEEDVFLRPVIEHAVEALSETVDDREITVKTPIVVLQPNVPFRRPEDIDRALSEYETIDNDVVISIVQEKDFFWQRNNIQLNPLFSADNRLKGDSKSTYKETGSITVTNFEYLQSGNWTGNSPGYIVTDKISSFKIDTLLDFWLAQKIASGPTIAFRVDGGDNLGLGKVYRGLTLATELHTAINCDIKFICDQRYASGIELVESHDFPVSIISEEMSDIEHMYQIDPDIIFVDIEDPSEEYLQRLHDVSAAIVNFENLNIEHADFILNPQRHFTNSETNNHLNGPDYLVLRDEFRNVSSTIKNRAENILLTFGGTDPLGLTIDCVRILGERELPFNYRVVLGPGFEKKDELRSLPEETYSQFEFLENVSNMGELMEWADIALSSGGRTVYELAATGTPSIVIAQNEGEVERTKLLREQRAIVFLGNGKNIDLQLVPDHLTSLADDTERRSFLSNRGKSTVDGQGIQRILNLVEEILVGSE